MAKQMPNRDVEVINETSRLLSLINFSADCPAYAEGSYVAISVDLHYTDHEENMKALITCLSLGSSIVEWEGLRINIDKQNDGNITWIAFLDSRGQTIRSLPVSGEYTLSLPHGMRSQVIRRAVNPPIRARHSVGHGDREDATPKPFEKEGQFLEGSLSWRIKANDSGEVRLSIWSADPEMENLDIIFSLIESGSGRLHHCGKATIRAEARAESVLLDSVADINNAYDLVIEPSIER